MGSASTNAFGAERLYLYLLTAASLFIGGAFLFSTFHTGRKVTPEFMLASLTLPCSPTDFARYTDLVVVITSDKEDIAKLRKSLPTIKSVVPLAKMNQTVSASFYKFRDDDNTLLAETRNEAVWVGYAVENPTAPYTPSIPIPLMFSKQHTMRLLGIGRGPYVAPNQADTSFLPASNASTAGARDTKLLLQAVFTPDEPNTSVQNAELAVTFFGENVCGDKKKPGA